VPATAAAGTQTTAIGTEHVLATLGQPGTYVLVIDCSLLAADESLDLRLYVRTRAGSPSALAYADTFAGPQADPVKISVPVPVVHEIRATLRQTAGAPRDYDWELLAL
jgi:hypothetical protein